MGEMALGHRPMTMDRDADLVEALRGQKPGAVETLIALYGDRTYRLAMRITGDSSDAEEVVQDAFWKVVRTVEKFRGDAVFGSWLYRIVANFAYTKLRARHLLHDETSLDEETTTLDQHVPSLQDWSAHLRNPAVQTELRTALTAALDTLPKHYRAIVVLRDVEGLSPQQVSQITGLSVGVVKTRTHRARQVLRVCLGEYFSDRSASAVSRPTVVVGGGRRSGMS